MTPGLYVLLVIFAVIIVLLVASGLRTIRRLNQKSLNQLQKKWGVGISTKLEISSDATTKVWVTILSIPEEMTLHDIFDDLREMQFEFCGEYLLRKVQDYYEGKYLHFIVLGGKLDTRCVMGREMTCIEGVIPDSDHPEKNYIEMVPYIKEQFLQIQLAVLSSKKRK